MLSSSRETLAASSCLCCSQSSNSTPARFAGPHSRPCAARYRLCQLCTKPRKPSKTFWSSLPMVARRNAYRKSSPLPSSSVSPRIVARISSAAAAALGPSNRSNFPPVIPSSYWKPRTTLAKNPSIVPSVSRGSARTTRSSDSAKSASGSDRSSRSSAAFGSSLAAAASLVSTESANSPAALRVKVSATIFSGATPIATKPITRFASWKVFPDPAEARISRFLWRIFIVARSLPGSLEMGNPEVPEMRFTSFHL